MIGKSSQNGLFRSRLSILGQPPSPSQKLSHSKWGILKRERYIFSSLLLSWKNQLNVDL
ncbi:MAG: hypothetical protein V3V31_02080 [Methylococcales bacterium]